MPMGSDVLYYPASTLEGYFAKFNPDLISQIPYYSTLSSFTLPVTQAWDSPSGWTWSPEWNVRSVQEQRPVTSGPFTVTYTQVAPGQYTVTENIPSYYQTPSAPGFFESVGSLFTNPLNLIPGIATGIFAPELLPWVIGGQLTGGTIGAAAGGPEGAALGAGIGGAAGGWAGAGFPLPFQSAPELSGLGGGVSAYSIPGTELASSFPGSVAGIGGLGTALESGLTAGTGLGPAGTAFATGVGGDFIGSLGAGSLIGGVPSFDASVGGGLNFDPSMVPTGGGAQAFQATQTGMQAANLISSMLAPRPQGNPMMGGSMGLAGPAAQGLSPMQIAAMGAMQSEPGKRSIDPAFLARMSGRGEGAGLASPTDLSMASLYGMQ